MKKLRNVFLLLGCFSALSIAQTAPDFTVNDIDGNTHHLYSYLDEGMHVLLLFSYPDMG